MITNMARVQAISKMLKSRRHQLGLSLSALARRTDTSPATISRYENGWNRFELGTLRKLATALGCELEIHLTPIERPEKKLKPRELIAQLGRLFWDHQLRPADLRNHRLWVVERVLEYGALSDVLALRDSLGKPAFLDCIRQARLSSNRTRTFWQQMLSKKDGSRMRRSFRNEADSCWPPSAR